MSFMQVFFVGLSPFPVSCYVGLLLVELLYIAANLVPYLKSRHLKSVFMLIPKIVQSLFLIAIEAILLYSYMRLPSQSLPIQPHV